jgi:hypothetical protein
MRRMPVTACMMKMKRSTEPNTYAQREPPGTGSLSIFACICLRPTRSSTKAMTFSITVGWLLGSDECSI